MIKQGFKFLDTFSLGLKHKVMFFRRKCYQVTRAVVALNSIKVVNKPAFWQGLIVYLLPYQDMFKHITLTSLQSSRMVGGIYKNISLVSYRTTTFPKRRCVTFWKLLLRFLACSPSINQSTVCTSGSLVRYFSTTIKAIMRVGLSPFPHRYCTFGGAISSFHNRIITLPNRYCQVQDRLDMK